MSAAAAPLADLYAADETAWLDAMAAAARRGDARGLDLPRLAEYLTDMAIRDRREVKSRLVVLLMHVLKWEYQPAKRSRSWRTTTLAERQHLADLTGRGVLRAHAEAVLAEAFGDAVVLAASETNLPPSAFPAACPFTLPDLLAVEPAGDVE